METPKPKRSRKPKAEAVQVAALAPVEPTATFRLGVIMKQWARPSITQFTQGWLSRLVLPGVELVRVSVTSPGDPYRAPQVDGWEYVSAPNEPLNGKGNAAVQALKGRVDAILNLGSDDLCTPAYILEAVRLIREGVADVVLPKGLAFYDLLSTRAMVVDAPRIGAGRVVSASVLEALGWYLWPQQGHLPDQGMDERFKLVPGIKKAKIDGMGVEAKSMVIDIKCHDNMGSFDQVLKHRGPQGQAHLVEPQAVWDGFGVTAEEVEALHAAYTAERLPVAMRALVHVPASLVSGDILGERFDIGQTFETDRERASLLIRYRYAEFV